MTVTRKLYKWFKDGKITNVWVVSDGGTEYIQISGYNPFPFFSETKFKTTKKVFESWMLKNGYKKCLNFTECFGYKETKTIK